MPSGLFKESLQSSYMLGLMKKRIDAESSDINFVNVSFTTGDMTLKTKRHSNDARL